jgi:hypothetical protein
MNSEPSSLNMIVYTFRMHGSISSMDRPTRQHSIPGLASSFPSRPRDRRPGAAALLHRSHLLPGQAFLTWHRRSLVLLRLELRRPRCEAHNKRQLEPCAQAAGHSRLARMGRRRTLHRCSIPSNIGNFFQIRAAAMGLPMTQRSVWRCLEPGEPADDDVDDACMYDVR